MTNSDDFSKAVKDTRYYFISHAHSPRDNELADKLDHALGRFGLEGFFDLRSIDRGASIPRSIGEAIARADLFIPILSFDTKRSKWVQHEIETAIAYRNKNGKPVIISVLIDPCEAEMPPLLVPLNYCIFYGRNFDEALWDFVENDLGLKASNAEVEFAAKSRDRLIKEYERKGLVSPQEILSRAGIERYQAIAEGEDTLIAQRSPRTRRHRAIARSKAQIPATRALRLSHPVGRQKEEQIIRQAINDGQRSRVIYMEGTGGIGKTMLLEEVHKWRGKCVCTPIIDLYTVNTNSAVEQVIVNTLGSKHFERYFTARAHFQKRLETHSPEALATEGERFAQLFVEDFNTAAQKKRIILRLDTVETVQFERAQLEKAFGIQPPEIELKTWLLRVIPHLENTVTLFAGRPHPELYASLKEALK